MIESEKSHQNISDYIQILLKKRFELNNKKGLIIVKKGEISVIITIIMLTRSSDRIFNPSCYTGMYFCFVVGMKIDVVITESSPDIFRVQ